MDRAQALVIALAKSLELTHRVRQLEKSSGMDLADGTKIRARRDEDGRLIISQIVKGQEHALLTMG